MTTGRAGASAKRDWIRPAPLQFGSRIQIVAPSSPFDVELVQAGIAWLREHFDVVCAPDMFERRLGYLAGSDERRLEELQSAIDDTRVSAIVAARGGYGLTRILPRLDYRSLVKAHKWVIGFSDLTALHLELGALGLCSLHGPNAAGLGRDEPDKRATWLSAVTTQFSADFPQLTILRPGTAEGPLCGGNLTVFFTQLAANRVRLPPGSILFLEDVTETSYRIDRMLTALVSAGVFSHVAGVVLGEFTDCSPGKYDVPVERVLREHFEQLSIPVLADLPSGHGSHNAPLLFGARARIESDTLTLR